MMKHYSLLAILMIAFTFSMRSQAPSNDVCANAIPITVNGGYVSGTNAATVTNGPNPNCGGTAINDVWYSFVYTAGSVVVETQLGTNTDTRLAVYSACGGTQIACNDDYSGSNRSYIALSCTQLTAGNTYYIQAGGFNQIAGTFTIQVTSTTAGCTDPAASNYNPCATTNNGSCTYVTVPSNDICANAIQLTPNAGYFSTNNNNTVTNGPNPSCGGSTTIKDVWFKFVHTGGNVVVETQLGTCTDTRIAIFSACGGTQLACNDDYGGTYRSYIALACSTLTVGNTYYIQAGGYNAAVGTFTIQVTSNGSVGCTDPMATNFAPCAVANDGSCVYPVTQAAFNYAPTANNCLSIQYTSTSSGNLSSFEWSFPGGSPSSSTAQNPVVNYPGPGTYSATLTVTDVNSGTSTVTNNAINVNSGEFVTIDITPDANPTQTSWKLFDNNNVIVAQGTFNDATFCITDVCHRFEIYDAAGNGLTGGGNYKIYLNGILVESGAAFASDDIRFVNCPDGISCDNSLTAAEGLNDVPFDNTWYTFIPDSTGQYRISTCGLATCDTKIWVYDYCTMANFDDSNEATYTYNDDFCGVQAEINVFMIGGNTYYVRVGSTGSCASQSYEVLYEYAGPAVGCMDVLACNYNPLATAPATCYYNGDPNCSNLGPDLLVDLNSMFTSLVSSTVNGTDNCLVNEGCLQGLGTRQVLKFTTRIANIGNQDYFIGAPNASNPQFEFDQCHNHYHYEGYAEYLLYDQNGNPMDQIGFKNGFCVLDLSCPSGITAQYSCGNMGITAGCADIYSSSLSCQWIDITDVPAGDYYLVIRTNWDHSPDAAGRYELRYDNNWAQVCIHFDRDPVTNAVINFTKTITSCPVIEDCLGTPFGDVYPDCAGNCPGTVIKGDYNQDGFFTAYDEHLYAEAAVYGGATVTPCNDLNDDGEITVADAAYAGSCIHQQEDLGVPPLQYTSCPWDAEFLDFGENVTLGLTNLNSSENYFDIYIVNPINEIIAFQVDIDGVSISSIENLIPANWSAHLHFEANGNSIAVLSNAHSEIPTYSVPTAVVRVHYNSISTNTLCISNIVDVINDLVHNTLTTYGDCVSVVPNVTADFISNQTSVCAGNSISFTDTSLGNPTSWSWTFEGGTPSTSTDQNPVVTYNTPGVYGVSLTVSGPGGSDTDAMPNFIFVGITPIWYADSDGDGYGDASSTLANCIPPDGYVAIAGDCNDASGAVNPAASEVCNGIDDNCNDQIDEGFDTDGDGYTSCAGDCDDNNSLIHPGALELCNGVDEDCDTSIDEGFDQDGDGFTVCAGDCNDENASIHPNALEVCNNIDDDCDVSADEGLDMDGDGYTACSGDCDDLSGSVNPAANESCNGIDDNCNGLMDEGFDADGDGFTSCNGDCDDSNASINPESAEVCNNVDDDCNDSIDEGFDADGDGFTSCAGDCNDNSASVYPGATEVCNGGDDNCNNLTDEGLDNDNDGYTPCAGDCDDNNSSINPGASDVCNGIDDNCNGTTDEQVDADADGFTACGGDCDDQNAAIFPGATETCNNADDDCDGSVDEGFDADSDGFTACAGDCNDANSSVFPGANEECNATDDDCDGSVDEGFDNDNDGYTVCAGDCNDNNALINPGAAEACNGIDDNCNLSIDEGFDLDGDGFTSCNGDCNDNNALVYPGRPENCNGIDDDCDNAVDEGFDADGDGFTSCGGDCNDGNAAIRPGVAESCNGTDDNCNGTVDENAGAFYYQDSDGDGFGNPNVALQSCSQPAGYVTNNLDCNDANANRNPNAIEACNNIDDDCDGLIDDNCSNVPNDFYENAIVLTVFPYNTCTGTSGTLSGATASAQAQSTVTAGGQDVWYKFIATEPGIRLRVTTTAADVLIELQNSTGGLVDVENIQNIKGNEFLNRSGLTVGATYFVAVRNNNSALGTGSFVICATGLPETACQNATGSYSICGTFKAISTAASSYTFNFTSQTTGLTYTRNQASNSLVLTSTPGLPANDNYTVRTDAVYNLTAGNGSTDIVTVQGLETCTATIPQIAENFLRSNQTCPSARLMGSQIRTNNTVCGAQNTQWEFQLANLSQAPFYISTGTSTTLTLTTAAGFALGQTYNVRIRTTLVNGYTGPWGPVRCMVISSSGMIMEDENAGLEDAKEGEVQVNLYPNPNNGESFNLYVNEVEKGEVSVRILDGMGRLLHSNKFIAEGYLNTQLDFASALPSGMYVVEIRFDDQVVSKRMLVQK